MCRLHGPRQRQSKVFWFLFSKKNTYVLALAHATVNAAWLALLQVILIDVTLAGDNAVVVGLAVSGLPRRDRASALAFGIAAAAIIRTILALVAVRLLSVIGLTLAGGVLLAWVCWRMYRELRAPHTTHHAQGTGRKTLRQAVVQIAIADISMSLDNVLAVAGAAHAHPVILVTGLVLSVLLMGIAAGLLSRLLHRYRWIAWVGLAVVVFVAARMLWEGSLQVGQAIGVI